MLKNYTLLAVLVFSSFLVTAELAQAQSKSKSAIDWSKLQIPQGQNTNSAPTTIRERGVASQSTSSDRLNNSKNDLNVYASCVDTHGLIHGSNTRYYDSCLGQTVGGRQQFVQDASRGVMLMLDVSRFGR